MQGNLIGIPPLTAIDPEFNTRPVVWASLYRPIGSQPLCRRSSQTVV